MQQAAPPAPRTQHVSVTFLHTAAGGGAAVRSRPRCARLCACSGARPGEAPLPCTHRTRTVALDLVVVPLVAPNAQRVAARIRPVLAGAVVAVVGLRGGGGGGGARWEESWRPPRARQRPVRSACPQRNLGRPGWQLAWCRVRRAEAGWVGSRASRRARASRGAGRAMAAVRLWGRGDVGLAQGEEFSRTLAKGCAFAGCDNAGAAELHHSVCRPGAPTALPSLPRPQS